MRLAGWSDFILVNETQQHAYRLPIRDDVVFGRSSHCDIVLRHDSIGRRHGRLHVKGDRVEIIDHGTTNGVYLNGTYVQRAMVNVGETIQIGGLRLRLEPIAWLGDGPPRTGTLDGATARARMTESFVKLQSPLTDAERDDVWWSLYADWWTTNGDEHLFQDAWRLWTPATLRRLRRGFDEQPRWFLAHGFSVFNALIAHTGLGELLGFDLLMSTTHDAQRDHAEWQLQSRASATRRSLVAFVLDRLDPAEPEAPRFLGHILHRAMQDRAPFQLVQMRELAHDARLLDVVASVLFVTFDRSEPVVFRPEAGELLTLDGIARIAGTERVRVARPEDIDVRWADELASHEVVQPFPQL